jgi:hypothetical protein
VGWGTGDGPVAAQFDWVPSRFAVRISKRPSFIGARRGSVGKMDSRQMDPRLRVRDAVRARCPALSRTANSSSGCEAFWTAASPGGAQRSNYFPFLKPVGRNQSVWYSRPGSKVSSVGGMATLPGVSYCGWDRAWTPVSRYAASLPRFGPWLAGLGIVAKTRCGRHSALRRREAIDRLRQAGARREGAGEEPCHG